MEVSQLGKIKLYELAKDLNLTSKDLLDKAIHIAQANNISRKTINEILDILYKESK